MSKIIETENLKLKAKIHTITEIGNRLRQHCLLGGGEFLQADIDAWDTATAPAEYPPVPETETEIENPSHEKTNTPPLTP